MENVAYGDVKRGDVVEMKSKLVRVTDPPKHFRTGKHGSARVVLKGKDVRTEKTVEDTAPAHAMLRRATVQSCTRAIHDVTEEGMYLLHEDGTADAAAYPVPDAVEVDALRRAVEAGVACHATVKLIGGDLTIVQSVTMDAPASALTSSGPQ